MLSGCALFRGCERAIVERIAPHVSAIKVQAGTVVQRAGSSDAQIGIVFSGRVLVRSVNAASGQAAVLEELQIGDSFGEVGAMLQLAQPHEAFVETQSTVLILSKDVVQQLVTKVPAFAHAIAKKLASKIVQLGIASLRATPARGITVAPPIASEPAPNKLEAGIRFVKIASYTIDAKLLALVPARLITQHRVLPLEMRGRTLTIGMIDPFNSGAIAELGRVITSADLEFVAVSLDDWSEAVVRLKIDPGARGVVAAKERLAPETIQFEGIAETGEAKTAAVIGDEVVNMTTRIIATAIERGASDVHIETEATGVRVRYRVGGSLVDWDQIIPPSYSRGIVARIKVLAGLDITERRLPQDGRVGLRAAKREVDLRVSTLPASRGEKVVMRVFEAATMLRPLDAIFMDHRVLGAVRSALNRPHGAIIVAGPTGSGKSSTLYAALNERRKTRPDTNIVMVEDPIEYKLAGATQVQVNHGVELTFARVLRAFLRQDPDVIMVGEIRDRETALMALEAAMTGHLLFTSIHANDAFGVINRFENLGCQRQVVAQALALVLVQRLARRVCPRCVTSEVPTPLLLESLQQRSLVERGAQVALPRGAGCAECLQTGYQGRIAVIEALQFPDTVRDMLMTNASLAQVEEHAIKHQAYIPFRRSAGYLMSRDLLTPTEALLTVA